MVKVPRMENASKANGLKDLVRRMKERTDSDLDSFMVIGIDFGTTYSGAAWATLADFENNQINYITSWPGTGREESKAPTELFYEDGQILWGYSVPRDVEPLRWFKLLLLREEDLTAAVQQSEILLRGREMLKELDKTPIDLVADYLKGLWSHVLTTMRKARSKSVVEALAFHVVVTVPAMWPDYARRSMTEALQKAGIFDGRPAGPTTLAFAPEPEAAALVTLWERAPDLREGDDFTICDAGGGTVDLISYVVSGLDPIQLKEAVVGTGGLCGGAFIDKMFKTICASRLGRLWRNLTHTGVNEIMKDEWEHGVKPQFNIDDASRKYIVSIPAEAFRGSGRSALNDQEKAPFIKNGRVHFASSDMKPAFDNVFRDIQKLIDNQISEAVKNGLRMKGIILVGGLGCSPYLYQYLEDKYAILGTQILQFTGIGPRTAICRGAIFKGYLDVSTTRILSGPSQITVPIGVLSTMARKSLGLRHRITFCDWLHSDEDKKWDAAEGEWKAKNQMKWYLRKGENVCKRDPVRHGFYVAFCDQKQFEKHGDHIVDIYECNDSAAPSRYTSSVKKLCQITVTMDITFDQLEDYLPTSGRKLKRFVYQVEMVPSGASNEFTVYRHGKKLASQSVTVEFL